MAINGKKLDDLELLLGWLVVIGADRHACSCRSSAVALGGLAVAASAQAGRLFAVFVAATLAIPN